MCAFGAESTFRSSAQFLMVYLQFTKIHSPNSLAIASNDNKHINTNDFRRNTNKLHLIEDDKKKSETKCHLQIIISPHCGPSTTIQNENSIFQVFKSKQTAQFIQLIALAKLNFLLSSNAISAIRRKYWSILRHAGESNRALV